MDRYITGTTIRELREQRKMTQQQLAEILCVSEKTVSKWETMRGLPDITLLEPIADAFGISVPELISGNRIKNTKTLKTCLYRLYKQVFLLYNPIKGDDEG